jgi:hypothetical protein
MNDFAAIPRPRLVAYLLGALGDATWSRSHGTVRYGQADVRWLQNLKEIFDALGDRSWIYREGATRRFWVLESSAKSLRQAVPLASSVGAREGLDFVRGFFDAEGGMPQDGGARMYLQFSQKDLSTLESVRAFLEADAIACGRIHNPSARVDPDYWRFYVRAGSHEAFMRKVGSWHPRKLDLMRARLRARDSGASPAQTKTLA